MSVVASTRRTSLVSVRETVGTWVIVDLAYSSGPWWSGPVAPGYCVALCALAVVSNVPFVTVAAPFVSESRHPYDLDMAETIKISRDPLERDELHFPHSSTILPENPGKFKISYIYILMTVFFSKHHPDSFLGPPCLLHIRGCHIFAVLLSAFTLDLYTRIYQPRATIYSTSDQHNCTSLL